MLSVFVRASVHMYVFAGYKQELYVYFSSAHRNVSRECARIAIVDIVF